MRKSLKSHETGMRKSWENIGIVKRKSSESPEKVMRR